MSFRVALRAVSIAGALLVAVSGCVLEPIDLANRRCPCVDGWRCDEARDRCVLARADGSIDASADADPPDAWSRDGRAEDPLDAARDASATDLR